MTLKVGIVNVNALTSVNTKDRQLVKKERVNVLMELVFVDWDYGKSSWMLRKELSVV